MDIYPYLLTYGGPQLFVLVVIFFVTPMVYRRFWRQWPPGKRYLSVAGLWFGAIVVAYGDVFLIGLEARRLCRDEAGMRVYRTIQAEGILGGGSVRDLVGMGIKFVERDTPMGRPIERVRYENGEYKREELTEFLSEVEFEMRSIRRSRWVVESRDLLIERSNGAVLSEIVAFKFYPAWLDSWLLKVLGFSWAPPRCDDDYPPRQEKRTHYISELMRKTLNTK